MKDAERILMAFLEELVRKEKGEPIELALDDVLLSSGLLDSWATLEIVELLESRFGLKLEMDDLDITKLDTPRRILELIAGDETKRNRSGD